MMRLSAHLDLVHHYITPTLLDKRTFASTIHEDMSKETRIGIFASIAIATLIIGYQYLKGINLFSSSNIYYALYEDVDQLNLSDPVYLNGVQVGSVQEITFNPSNLNEIKVGFDLRQDLQLPKKTTASIASASLMGGKMVILKPMGTCAGADCLSSGEYLIGNKQGMFDAFFGSSDSGETNGGPADMIKDNLGDIVDTLAVSLSDPSSDHAIAQSFRRLEGILTNLEKTSAQLDILMARSSRKLNGTLSNVESITGNIESSNADLTAMIQNMSTFSKNLKDADVAGLMDQAKTTMATTDKSVAALQTTLTSAEASLNKLTETLEAVNKGEGTLGKLMNEEELYDNMLRTSKNLDLLLQDFRLNPKRYVNVSVFGKKQKKYEVPEDDPAFEEEQKDD